MEYNNINISEFEEAIMKTVKEKIEKLIDPYLAENIGIWNSHYQRHFTYFQCIFNQLKTFLNLTNIYIYDRTVV